MQAGARSWCLSFIYRLRNGRAYRFLPSWVGQVDRDVATDLLTQLSVTRIPVDPVWIARRQGLVVEEEPLPSGVYGRSGKRATGSASSCQGWHTSASAP